LWKKDSIGSEIGYLNAKYSYEQNKASLDQLKIQLRKTTLTSTVNGVLETQFVKAGEMVMPGTQVVRLIGTDKVKVEVGVPANYAGVIRKGEEAVISFDAYPDKEFKSIITTVGSSIQTQSRTFKVELELENTKNDFKIDMVANVILETNNFDEAIVVNQEYVYRTENGYEVFLAGKDDNGNSVAKRQSVTLGPGFDNKVVIKSGLKVGDKLITTGSGDVENMTRIQVVTTQPTMASKN
jgi:RND family efflux transporter MFP subunit